jgi:hypothetical protein
MMKYERKKCDNCKMETQHRIDSESGDCVCLRCNNSESKCRLGYKR